MHAEAAQLQPQVAIVTGAGSGIGRHVALQLAAAGASIALVGRNLPRLHETFESIAAKHGQRRAIIIPADLTDPAAARLIVDRTQRQWGRVDVLVNNAGAGYLVPLHATTEDLLEYTFAVNFHGPVRLIALLWRVFAAQRRGCIVNISSMASIDPFPGLGIYAASKAALDSLTRSIMNEGREIGLRAFSIKPGAVETALLRSVVSKEQLPEHLAHEPAAVASVVVDCICGRREEDIGRCIQLPTPMPPGAGAGPGV